MPVKTAAQQQAMHRRRKTSFDKKAHGGRAAQTYTHIL